MVVASRVRLWTSWGTASLRCEEVLSQQLRGLGLVACVVTRGTQQPHGLDPLHTSSSATTTTTTPSTCDACLRRRSGRLRPAAIPVRGLTRGSARR